MKLILYSKPGCHLCEGLQEKLEQIHQIPLDLEVRDITSQEEWFDRYQFEIPVLVWVREHATAADSPTAITLPRLSPRASVRQVEQMLQKYLESITE